MFPPSAGRPPREIARAMSQETGMARRAGIVSGTVGMLGLDGVGLRRRSPDLARPVSPRCNPNGNCV